MNGERDASGRLESYLWRLLDGGPVILPDGGTHRVRHVYGLDVARWKVFAFTLGNFLAGCAGALHLVGVEAGIAIKW